MNKKCVHGKYFYGNEISEYGQEKGYVDYRTLAKAFDAVMANELMEKTANIGYWELENGDYCYYKDDDGNDYTEAEREERLEGLREELDNLDDEEDSGRIAEIQTEIKNLENADYYEYEVFQWFIISSNGAEILKDYTNEIVYYNEELDLYLWGVTHWGTTWDYVLTNIKCDVSEE